MKLRRRFYLTAAVGLAGLCSLAPTAVASATTGYSYSKVTIQSLTVTAATFTVHWRYSPGRASTEVSKFLVEYDLPSNTFVGAERVYRPSATSATFTGLTPDTQYKVFVTAYPSASFNGLVELDAKLIRTK